MIEIFNDAYIVRNILVYLFKTKYDFYLKNKNCRVPVMGFINELFAYLINHDCMNSFPIYDKPTSVITLLIYKITILGKNFNATSVIFSFAIISSN